jgi:hypothetical protein
MSNVLIGIIGVILFIGLALAGALILGDDFLSASRSSKIAATTAQMQQVVAAVNMYNLKTGTRLMPGQYNADEGAILRPRYLSSKPRNPLSTVPIYLLDEFGRSDYPAYVAIALLPRDPSSKATCTELAATFGKVPEDAYYVMPKTGVGCAYSSNDPLHWSIYANIY